MKKFSKSTLTLITIIFISTSGCKKKEVPVVETNPVSEISGTSAVSGGNITDDRGETVLSRGVCWSTGIKPSISDNKSSDGAGAGNYSSTITNLLPATDYYIRAYATSSSGTGYGMTMAFKTSGSVPSITTYSPSNVALTSANILGLVNPNFISTTVTIEYGTSANYGSTITATQKPLTGNTDQLISVSISALTSGTTYHFRIRAENSSGITYGADKSFKTLGGPPTVNILAPTNILGSSATLKGLVNANYFLSTVTFEYGPTISYGSVITAIQSPVMNSVPVSVSAAVTGLTEGTIYHYRIKAENSIGITYSNDMFFTPVTPTNFIQDIEGNTYGIIIIGTQTWMAENLRTTKYNDNTTIPLVTDNAAWIALTTPGFCWYNNDGSGNKDTYGAIYNFYTASTGKLCPAGWHVPTDAEFITLTDYLGGINIAGGKLKETGTTNWLSPNTGATNESGFKALPGGQRDEYGAFIGLNQNAIFWSSTPYNTIKPWYRSLSYISSGVFVGNGSLNIRGFSIRCVKD